MQKFFLLIVGICAAFAQLLLFRETFPVFQGIDIITGFFVAHSIFALALGIFTASRLKFLPKTTKILIISIITLCIFVLASFILIRSARDIFFIPLGSGISLKTAVIYVFFVIFPVSFLQGIVSLRAMLLGRYKKNPIQDTFLYQGLGLVLGCLAFSFFIKNFLGLNVVFFIWILFAAAIYIILPKRKKIIPALCMLPAFIFIISGLSAELDKKLLERSFPSSIIDDYKYTSYGQTALTQKNGEYSFFINQILRFARPDNDVLNSEDFGHIPILHLEKPDNVLIIGGAAKYLPMIFEHNIKLVDYVEPDEFVIEMIKDNISHIGYVFENIRLNIHNENARKFISLTDNKYDLILIGLPEPVNLYINSYYTQDFFKKAKKVLKADGFIALNLPGRMAYSSFIMAELNKSVMEAMESVFENVQIVPGRSNILIASDKKMPYRMHIKQRLYKMQETTLVLSKNYLDDRMDTLRTRWLLHELSRVYKPNILNKDLNPQAMMLSVLYKQSAFSPYLSIFLDKVMTYSFLLIFVIIIIFFLSRSLYVTTSLSSGAAASWLVFNLVFALQIYTGQIFMWGGIIIAAFILGLLASIFYVRKYSSNLPLIRRMFIYEVGYLMLILIWFLLLQLKAVNVWISFFIVFTLGFLAGVEFILLKRMSKLLNKDAKTNIYALGVLGAWVSALFGGGFLILVWGIEGSLIFIFLFKFLLFCRWADLNKKNS